MSNWKSPYMVPSAILFSTAGHEFRDVDHLHGTLQFRPGHQPELHFGDHAEKTVASDRQPEEIPVFLAAAVRTLPCASTSVNDSTSATMA